MARRKTENELWRDGPKNGELTPEEELEEVKKMKFDPELIATIRRQVLDELKGEQERELAQKLKEREEAKKVHDEYLAKMKGSTDPWVEIQGWTETAHGVRVELEWNDAFVLYLKEQGVTGADDDQVVQRWITLLLRDMADQMEEQQPETKFE